MQRQIKLLTTLTTISLLFLISACGQSGPLYIPGNPSTMAVPPENANNEDGEEESTESPNTDR